MPSHPLIRCEQALRLAAVEPKRTPKAKVANKKVANRHGKYADPAKRREYMRDLMRSRRAK